MDWIVAYLERGSLKDRFFSLISLSPHWRGVGGTFYVSLGVLLEILGSPIRSTSTVAFQALNVPERNTVTRTAGRMIAVTVFCSQVELWLQTNLKSLQLPHLGILVAVNGKTGGKQSFFTPDVQDQESPAIESISKSYFKILVLVGWLFVAPKISKGNHKKYSG